jgi:hypothetical protein
MSNDTSLSKIISYSLWGSRKMFLHGAVVNAKQCRAFFPDWKVRIYHNSSVPESLLVTLRELGVDTIHVDPKGTYGTFWRFRPLFESGHDRILVRDIDSRITWRDVRCVNEWIESGKKFLNVRDHPSHYDWPIIAGIFGVRGGALPLTLVPIMEKYAVMHQYISDQVFLAHHVWDYMKMDVLELGFREHAWMSETWTVDGHMNLGFDEHEQPRKDHGVMGDTCI